MKRAALVLATSVALFICAVGNANAATRKYVSLPSNGSVVGSGSAARSGDSLTITGQPLEGEYIPSSYGGGSKGTKLPIKPKYDYSIPRTIKGMTTTLRGGVVGIGLTLGLEWMLDQVGGFIDDAGKVRIRGGGEPVSGGFAWLQQGATQTKNTAVEACNIRLPSVSSTSVSEYMAFERDPGSTSSSAYRCVYTVSSKTNAYTPYQTYISLTRQGQSCPDGTVYDASTGGCAMPSERPATDADFDLMEAAAAAQDSDWLKDRLREHCEGSLAPESCYEELRTSTQLEGPSTVTEKGPTTSTTGPGGTTSTTNNTKIDITYGDNYYDYRKTSTVTKTNPDGTTETETKTDPEEVTEEQEEQQEEMPEVTDLYKPYIDKLETIKTDVAAPPGVTSPIGYSSWYAFGGGCSEIHAQLPVIGSWSTSYCPLINDWVRPVLAFIFVMFTWHYCRSLWSEAVTKARPM
jgi:hypothetical protein